MTSTETSNGCSGENEPIVRQREPVSTYGAVSGASGDDGNVGRTADDSWSFTTSGKELFDEELKKASSASLRSSASQATTTRTLFGIWDGVFSSCMINMFGVVIFMRTGWMVGNAGIGQSLVIILLTVSVALVAALSAIGISQRCHLRVSGGIYLLLTHVLGARIGAAVGIIFCFGQSVACSLCVVAFGESLLDLVVVQSVWTSRAIAAALLIALVCVNVAGAQWVIGLQVVMLIVILVAIIDFVVGSFIRFAPDDGIVGYSVAGLVNNTGPDYLPDENFFTVLGVFFPSAFGVLAGVNMSGDLRDPKGNIAIGTLAAIVTITLIEVLVATVLGSTCSRYNLQTEYIIAEKLSATRIIFLIGVYVMSASAALGNLSGPPNVLHGIASDNVIGFLRPLSKGLGPENVPASAVLLLGLISLAFIFVGPLNTLGTILTIPYLLTYAAVDYAHFSLATSDHSACRQPNPVSSRPTSGQPSRPSSIAGDFDEGGSDLDLLFPEERRKSTASTTNRAESDDVSTSDCPADNSCTAEEDKTLSSESKEAGDQKAKPVKSVNFSVLCNRWISLIGSLVCVSAMFAIAWPYAIANILALIIIWYLIGRFNPLLFPGVSEFQLWRWIYDGITTGCRRRPTPQAVIIQPVAPSVERNVFDITTSQISDDNEDFAQRQPFHQSEFTTSHLRLD